MPSHIETTYPVRGVVLLRCVVSSTVKIRGDTGGGYV